MRYWFSDLQAVVKLELLRERRSPQLIPAMLLFGLGTIVLFRFASAQNEFAGQQAAAILMFATLLASLLGIGRLWAAEQDYGLLPQLRLSPISRSALLLGKSLALLIFLLATQVVTIPALQILALGHTPSIGTWLTVLSVVLLLDIGVAAVGALVGAIAAATSARELIVPLLAIPLLIPIVAISSKLLAPALERQALTPEPRWWLALAAYDSLFLMIGLLVSGAVIDD